MGAGIGTGKRAGNVEFCCQVPGNTDTSGATSLHSLLYLPQDFDITAINIIPTTNVTGTATDYRNINILADATEKANIDFDNGEDLVAHTPKAITVTAFTLTAGDHLNAQNELAGSGLVLYHFSLQIQGQWA